MTGAAVLAGILLVLLLATGFVLLAQLREDDRLALRIEDVQRRANMMPEAPAVDTAADAGLLKPVAALGSYIARSGLLSLRTLQELQQTLHTAGLRGRSGLSLFVGAKLLLLLGLPAFVFLVLVQLGAWSSFSPMFLAIAGVVGMLLPDLVVSGKRKAYLKSLDQGLPDALDMLVICSEAGLALEAAFERVSNEICLAHPVMSLEMQLTLQEMRVNVDRRTALTGLGNRTGLESLRRLGGTLVQTLQFGTPLAHALRTLSVEMRQELLTRFEERAAKLSVALTLPMILFILPCIFIVVGGPAVVQFAK